MASSDLKRDAKHLIKKWRKHLGIGGQWRIDLKVNETPTGNAEDDAQAHIAVEPGYFHAAIEINAWQLVGVDLEEVIVHEMLHIVTRPVETIVEGAMGERFAELGEQHLEALVERISRCLVRLDRA